MRFILLVIFSVISISPQINAQQNIKIPNSSLKNGWKGYGEAIDNVNDGDKWLKKGKGAIHKAIDCYLKALEYNPACAELNYKIGLCFLNSDQKFKAVTYLQTAYDKNKDIDIEVPLHLARALQYNSEFDKALEMYDSFYKSLKDRKKEKYLEAVYKYMDECKNGKELSEKPKRAVIINLGDSVNSVYSEYNPVITGNDSAMYITTRRPLKAKSKPNRLNYFYNEDIYVSEKKGDTWSKAHYLDDGDFNTKSHDAMLWASANTRYIYDGHKRNGDFYVSILKKGEWKDPKRLSRKFSSKSKESSLSLTGDGNVLYFIRVDQNEGFGGKDIFFARKKANGKWGKPQNIGNVINTKYDEDCVFVSSDGKTLYFSSKGHNSMGGYDIFKSVMDASGKWMKPENLGIPVNTPDDDLFYKSLPGEKKGYFSSERKDGLGGYDIYQVIFLGSEKQLVMQYDEQPLAYFYKPVSDFFGRISGELKIDTTYILKGRLSDAASKKPVVGRINIIDSDISQQVGSAISDSNGMYQIRLNKVKNYGVEINAKDYMFFLDIVNLPQGTKTREFVKDFALNKIKAGAKIVLKNIYFETGKAILASESFEELDKVVNFLKENNDLKIEISGHTDNVGNAAYNTKLSGNRAQAVVDYLVSKGIPVEQLVAKGYGPTQPIAPNTTAKGKALNRRVEFKILSTE